MQERERVVHARARFCCEMYRYFTALRQSRLVSEGKVEKSLMIL